MAGKNLIYLSCVGIESLLKYLFSEELLEYFKLTGVRKSKQNTLSVYQDEKNIVSPAHNDKQLVSHGADQPVNIHDFPLR